MLETLRWFLAENLIKAARMIDRETHRDLLRAEECERICREAYDTEGTPAEMRREIYSTLY